MPSEGTSVTSGRVHEIRLVVGTEQRSKVLVTEVIFHSVAWGIICSAWGASVNKVLCDNLSLSLLSKHYHPMAELHLLGIWLSKGDVTTNSDVLVSTCTLASQLSILGQVILLSTFKIVLVAIPVSISRAEASKALNFDRLKQSYTFRRSTISHSKIGGATESTWAFIIMKLHKLPWMPPTLFSSGLPPTTIFNMIDDKIGGGFQKIPKKAWSAFRDSSELAWDLSSDPRRFDYWVRCESVYSPGKKIIRTLGLHELSALWDFQLPDEDEMDLSTRRLLLSSLLHGPPGKMLRKLLYSPLRFLWDLL